MNALLEYNASAVAAGELWRLFTCHFVHWTLSHFLWDFAAFALLLIAAWRAGIPARQIAVVLTIVAMAIPLGLTGVVRYRGLSGLDSALFALVACHQLFDKRVRLVAVLCLSAFFAKLAFEIVTGTTLFAGNLGAGVVALPFAHLVGALVAVTCLILARMMRHARDDSSPSSPRTGGASQHA